MVLAPTTGQIFSVEPTDLATITDVEVEPIYDCKLRAKKISFVIPVYRNKASLETTQSSIDLIFRDNHVPLNYEIVFVDDGSDDGSLDELLRLRAANPNLKVISFSKNFGQVSAILAGMKEASGDAAVVVSADLQDPLNLVEQMIDEWSHGSEIVICHRTEREDSPLTSWFSWLAWKCIKFTFPKMPSGGFDFFLLDRSALNTFNEMKGRNRFMQGDVLSLGYRTSFIPYKRQQRKFGKSQWTFEKRLKYFLDAIIDSSYLPIRFMSTIGILTALSGFAYAVLIVFVWFQHKTPFNGWAPIVIITLITDGLIMFMLGMIGEYVWRTCDEVKGKPRFVIREKYTD